MFISVLLCRTGGDTVNLIRRKFNYLKCYMLSEKLKLLKQLEGRLSFNIFYLQFLDFISTRIHISNFETNICEFLVCAATRKIYTK